MLLKLSLSVLFVLSTLVVKAQGEVITDTTKMNYGFLFVDLPYYRVNYTYQSVAPDGVTPVTLSAAMVFPQKVFERSEPLTIGGQTYDASGLLLNNHFTITQQSKAPTQTESMDIEGPLSTLGPRFITISPDGYGFGTTVDKPQAYLMADATARHNIDAVKAARRLLRQMNYRYGELFTQLGYSQGAHSAMAVQRYLDTRGAEADGIPYLNYTLCGAGPYDLRAMLDTLLLPGARFRYPCALPLIVQGQIEGANLDISYSDCLRQPLDTKTLEWLNAKTYSSDKINDSIFAVTGGNDRTGLLVSNILCTENFSPSNSKMQPFFDAVDRNTLVSGWRPGDHTRFFVYHSKDDEIVPFFSMDHLYQFLKEECGIGSDRLETAVGVGTHESAASAFVISANSKLVSMELDYMSGSFDPTTIHQMVVDEPAAATSLSGWYTLQGQRLPVRPRAAGLYIHNGKKVMVRRR